MRAVSERAIYTLTAGQYEHTQGSTAYIVLSVPLLHTRKGLQLNVLNIDL